MEEKKRRNIRSVEQRLADFKAKMEEKKAKEKALRERNKKLENCLIAKKVRADIKAEMEKLFQQKIEKLRIPKKPDKNVKITNVPIYHNPLVDTGFDESDLYLTRKEIQEAEKNPYETGKINWSAFYRLAAKGRKEADAIIRKMRK